MSLTYCTLYYDECDECPMAKAGNRCIHNPESSYRKARGIWIEKATEEDKEKLRKLGERFEKEYKEK